MPRIFKTKELQTFFRLGMAAQGALRQHLQIQLYTSAPKLLMMKES